MRRRVRMGPQFDYDSCICCGECEEVCPLDVIRCIGPFPYPAYSTDCVGCELCASRCPTNSVQVPLRKVEESAELWWFEL